MANNTKYVILGLLTETPLSGYEIKKLINLRFRFFWSESYGQLYPELKRLTTAGLIEGLPPLDGSLRGKQMYKLTDAGRAELVQWLVLPVATESVRLELLLKMYFASLAPKSNLLQQVDAFKAEHRRDLSILGQFRRELESIDDPYGNHGDILRVIDFGIRANQAYLDWSDATIHYLQGGLPHETKNA